MLVAVAFLATACGATVPTVPPAVEAVPVFAEVGEQPVREADPTGVVRVAYPDEASGFLDLAEDDATARDLLSLWGLPLFETDPSGALRPGLVTRSQAGTVGPDSWVVVLELAAGEWSDGTPVTSADVVATVEALRATARAAELTPLLRVEAAGSDSVRLHFSQPYARWPYLLDGVGVLPATVLADGGLGAYDDGVPVSGGRFRLLERDPGRSLRFVAHPASPLGAPAVAEVEVLVVPRFEAALALLADGRAEVATGYLALNGAGRARELDGVDAAEEVGGTWVGLDWRPDAPGAPSADERRRIRDAIDVTELVEGLLGGQASVLDVPLPHQTGRRAPRGPGGAVPDLTIVMPRWQEAVAFSARAVQRDLRSREAEVSLVSVGSPDYLDASRSQGDAALRIFRTGPTPSLTRWLDGDTTEVAVSADATLATGSARDRALAAVETQALVTPLYRPAVTAAWRAELRGFRPSAWEGVGLGSAGEWTIGPDDGPDAGTS